MHQQYMQQAIELARKAEGRTAPNPPVGAVIVRDDVVVGRGFHPRAGEPHAETFALVSAGAKAAGGDIYVTLEPCSHQGKTGPCADALIAAGIKRVFIGVQDPNPQVAGRGIEKLQQAGIEVEVGIETEACQRLLAPFARLITSGMPYTIYKAAMTLDGKTATSTGDSKWISGKFSRQRVHQLRDRVEAIMVGIETVLADDPQLNTRLPEGDGRDPLRVVVDSRLRMPAAAQLLHQQSEAQTLIVTAVEDSARKSALEETGAEVLVLPNGEGQVDLKKLWLELGIRNVQRLLLEGGATLAGAALKLDLIDQMMLFVAPKMVGGGSPNGIFAGEGCEKLANAVPLENLSYQSIGEDILICGEVKRCSQV